MYMGRKGFEKVHIAFLFVVIRKFTREADGLKPRVSGGKGIARNLPVAVDLLQNE